MSNLPLEFDDKVNHPELEAFFQQFGLEKYISAPEFNKMRDAINELFFYSDIGADTENKLIHISKIEIIENVLYVRNFISPIIMKLSRWIINNELYADGTERSFPIPAVTAGYNRCDLLVVTENTDAPFKYIVGTEDSENFIEPSYNLFNEVRVIPVYVTSSGAETGGEVPASDEFITKVSQNWTVVNAVNQDYNQTFLSGFNKQNIIINNIMMGTPAYVSKGLNLNQVPVPANNSYYSGAPIRLANKTASSALSSYSVTLLHNATGGVTGQVAKYHFPDGENYTVKRGEVLTFVLRYISSFAGWILEFVSTNMPEGGSGGGINQNLEQVLETGSEAVLDYGETVSIKIDRSLEDSSETEFLQQNDKIAIIKKAGSSFAEAYAEGDNDAQKAGLRVGVEEDPDYNAIELENNAMTVIDRREESGLAYEGEYESNFHAKSLVSKKYVDDKVVEAIGDISTVSFLAVEELPETGQANIIYLVPNEEVAPNVKDEYIWLSGAWELIGSTELDLSNYVLKEDVIGNAGELPFTNGEETGFVLRKIHGDDFNIPSNYTANGKLAVWQTWTESWVSYGISLYPDSGYNIPLRFNGRLQGGTAVNDYDLVPLIQFNSLTRYSKTHFVDLTISMGQFLALHTTLVPFPNLGLSGSEYALLESAVGIVDLNFTGGFLNPDPGDNLRLAVYREPARIVGNSSYGTQNITAKKFVNQFHIGTYMNEPATQFLIGTEEAVKYSGAPTGEVRIRIYYKIANF